MEEQNNKAIICGEIKSNPIFSHELYGECFYEMSIECKRLSGTIDVLPVTISERLMKEYDFRVGATISAVCQLRSYNKFVDGKSKLLLTLFIYQILETKNEKHNNNIILQGYLCKPPIYRITPFNREITDLILAVNRSHFKSDYIPCIAWGRNATFSKHLTVGDKITIAGRIQSREYQKVISEDEVLTKTAYEVSISKLYVGERADEINKEII